MSDDHFVTSFNISEFNFSKEDVAQLENNLWVRNLWPLVYILSDDYLKEAYVGESTNAISRLTNHLAHKEKKRLSNLHIITSNKFNKSATLDIEANLIKYMSSDGKYKLLNSNIGIANHEYYQKNKYYDVFSAIWAKLQQRDVSIQSLRDIDNSDLFKFSPYKSLTFEQHLALKDILSILTTGSTSSIVVNGSAGTGKTILAIFLMKLLVTDLSILQEDLDNEASNISDTGGEFNKLVSLKQKFKNPKVAIVVAMTPLRKTLKTVFKQIAGLRADMVIGPGEVAKKNYDILLIDEAHRLRRRVALTGYGAFDQTNKKLGFDKERGTELDWVIKQSKYQIFFYDADQSVKPSDVRQNDFDKILPNAKVIKLKSQIRSNGGLELQEFIHGLLWQQLPPETLVFESDNYDLKLFDSLENLINQLKEKEVEHGLCRMVASFSWKWNSKGDKTMTKTDIDIQGLSLRWNSTDKDWINSENAINEIGCIHTVQGYDLNYTGIIFGKEISFDPTTESIVVVKQNYVDPKGSISIKTDEELHSYIVNIYKVFFSRARLGTYVYVYDDHLRDYLARYIPINHHTPSFRLYSLEEVTPFKGSVPYYDITVAAGDFSESPLPSETYWVKIAETYQVDNRYFVCRVTGESMNKTIPNGAWCLFKKADAGSREGEVVVVQHQDIQDENFGAGFTIKKYHSKKEETEDGWKHTAIELHPSSTDSSFPIIQLSPENHENLKVIGIFQLVLN